jgi:hypothetical protein
MARPLPHEWRVEATIWPTKANRRSASPTYKPAKSGPRQPSAPLGNAGAERAAVQITELAVEGQ